MHAIMLFGGEGIIFWLQNLLDRCIINGDTLPSLGGRGYRELMIMKHEEITLQTKKAFAGVFEKTDGKKVPVQNHRQ